MLVQFPALFFCSRSLRVRTEIEGLSTEYFTEFFVPMESFRIVAIYEEKYNNKINNSSPQVVSNMLSNPCAYKTF